MLMVHSGVLRNVVYFNEAKIPFQDQGLVTISGHNKDSRTAKDQNNGAGKTLLFSSFPNCMFSSAPSSTSKNSKNDMLDSSKSEIEYRFLDNQGRKVRVIQESSKWRIFINGEDQKVHRIEHQKKKIAELFPITEEEFYSYTYLTSLPGQRTHFQVKKNTDRLKFITDVFKLDEYDRMKKYFTQKRGEVKDEELKYGVVESKLLGVNTQLKKLSWNKERAIEAKEIEVQFEQMRDSHTALQAEVRNVEYSLNNVKRLEKLVRRVEELRAIVGDKDPRTQIDALKKKIKIVEAYDRYKEREEDYKRTTKKLRAKIKALESEDLPDADGLLTQFKQCTSELAAAKSKLESIEEQRSNIKQAKSKVDKSIAALSDMGLSAKEVDMDSDIESEISMCRTTLQLKKLVDHGSSECPTCKQTVDIKTLERDIKRAKKRLKELESLAEARLVVNKIKEYKSALRKLGKAKKSDKLERTVDSLEQHKTELQARGKKVEKLIDLRESLSEIKKPEAPDTIPPAGANVDSMREKIDVFHDLSHAVQELESFFDDNEDLYAIHKKGDTHNAAESLISKRKKLKKKLSLSDAQYKDLMTQKSKNDLARGEYKVLFKQKKEFEKDLEKSKPLIEKRELYKALEKAFGSKGLKVAKANEILGTIEANLNRYSHLVFAENFLFSLSANEKGIDCIVDRRNGKKSDVRLLSGAEADCFKLLFMLVLLLLVSPDRRTNFVVLDEPDCHMDDRTRELYIEQFLPFLCSIVPSVFVITPNAIDDYKNARNWTVVKENGVSSLHVT